MEFLPTDGRGLDERPLRLRQPIEAGRQQRRDRRRNRYVRDVPSGHPPFAVASQQAVVDQHPEHLLDEQRVALGDAGDPRPDV